MFKVYRILLYLFVVYKCAGRKIRFDIVVLNIDLDSSLEVGFLGFCISFINSILGLYI